MEYLNMDPILGFIGVILVLGGLVMYYVGLGKSVNHIVGFRVPPTMRNPEIWKTVNIRMAKIMFVHGVITTIAGLTISETITLVPAILACGILPLLGYMVYGTWYAYELEKRWLAS